MGKNNIDRKKLTKEVEAAHKKAAKEIKALKKIPLSDRLNPKKKATKGK